MVVEGADDAVVVVADKAGRVVAVETDALNGGDGVGGGAVAWLVFDCGGTGPDWWWSLRASAFSLLMVPSDVL